METRIKELEQSLERKTYECELAQNETTHLRENTQSLDQTKFKQEKSITEQVMLIQSLKRELKDKEALLEKQCSLSEKLSQQHEESQSQVTELKTQKSKLEQRVEQVKDEIGKGNTII